jgi:hypothetical protein
MSGRKRASGISIPALKRLASISIRAARSSRSAFLIVMSDAWQMNGPPALGGHHPYMGGKSPDDATADLNDSEAPLDSRKNFGGDGVQYVDPSIGSEHRPDAAQ